MSGTNTDTISYFTIYRRHCTVSQPNEDEDKLVIAGAVHSKHLAYPHPPLIVNT